MEQNRWDNRCRFPNYMGITNERGKLAYRAPALISLVKIVHEKFSLDSSPNYDIVLKKE
jgi:hypothetical protein